jgi:hypothetical protein
VALGLQGESREKLATALEQLDDSLCYELDLGCAGRISEANTLLREVLSAEPLPVAQRATGAAAVQRPLNDIASEVHACGVAWEPQARLIGNVRADEVAALAWAWLQHDPEALEAGIEIRDEELKRCRKQLAELDARFAAMESERDKWLRECQQIYEAFAGWSSVKNPREVAQSVSNLRAEATERGVKLAATEQLAAAERGELEHLREAADALRSGGTGNRAAWITKDRERSESRGARYCNRHGGYGFVADCLDCNADDKPPEAAPVEPAGPAEPVEQPAPFTGYTCRKCKAGHSGTSTGLCRKCEQGPVVEQAAAPEQPAPWEPKEGEFVSINSPDKVWFGLRCKVIATFDDGTSYIENPAGGRSHWANRELVPAEPVEAAAPKGEALCERGTVAGCRACFADRTVASGLQIALEPMCAACSSIYLELTRIAKPCAPQATIQGVDVPRALELLRNGRAEADYEPTHSVAYRLLDEAVMAALRVLAPDGPDHQALVPPRVRA